MTLQRQPTATRSAANRLHMEPGRLLYDDGHSSNSRVGSGKTQDSPRVDGWVTTDLDATSRMRQEGRRTTPSYL